MRIIKVDIPQMCIEAFADIHGLEMEVHERRLPLNHPERYFAHFHRADIMDGALLVGIFGDGATPEEAIKDYASKIEMKILVIDAMTKDRRELTVPRLIY